MDGRTHLPEGPRGRSRSSRSSGRAATRSRRSAWRCRAPRRRVGLARGYLVRSGSGRVKSDPLDALRAARALLAEERPAGPRAGGEREVLRLLLVTRRSAVDARKVALNQLRALLVTCPEPLRTELRPLTRARLLARLEHTAQPEQDDELAGTLLVLGLLARRIGALTLEERSLSRELHQRTSRIAPQLLAETGIGPISAAQTLVSWSHPGRLHSEAAFARLAGTAPIPASSGRTIRHRLDRGGDRQLNHSLHQIVLSRRRHHPPTAAYIAGRISQGKSEREAVRLAPALPRPPPLPAARTRRRNDLTLIEASFEQT